ncbi:DUF5805 domain-containing protein [Natronobiforma cellulositropha]|uniref:DUF5805 domain-containing protein n=1 Tax=Natronobiforma cellulositropha TaxID=1679076 RepID=UPI0021D5BC58|nr:DUF5805 domain-containing protein [Natronobiforma cellulositropha]
MDDHADTSRTSIKAYLPAYQKERWKAHADALEMNQSEFVRTMVQAGRKGFEPAHEEPASSDATPRGNALETQVLELLESDTFSWDELLEAVSEEIETRLEETLDELQNANRIHYSGRDGGYILVGGGDGQ